MTKPWRPADWDNPYPDLTEEALTEKYLMQAMDEPKSNYEIFEAGAEAMLEAIKELIEEEECWECGYDYHLTIPDPME